MLGRKSITPEKRKGKNKRADIIFAQKVQEKRLELGLTQAELAKIIGIPSPRVSEIEAGFFPSSRERIVAIADALGCTCDELLRAKG